MPALRGAVWLAERRSRGGYDSPNSRSAHSGQKDDRLGLILRLLAPVQRPPADSAFVGETVALGAAELVSHARLAIVGRQTCNLVLDDPEAERDSEPDGGAQQRISGHRHGARDTVLRPLHWDGN